LRYRCITIRSCYFWSSFSNLNFSTKRYLGLDQVSTKCLLCSLTYVFRKPNFPSQSTVDTRYRCIPTVISLTVTGVGSVPRARVQLLRPHCHCQPAEQHLRVQGLQEQDTDLTGTVRYLKSSLRLGRNKNLLAPAFHTKRNKVLEK
jgi:hypothetical protein